MSHLHRSYQIMATADVIPVTVNRIPIPRGLLSLDSFATRTTAVDITSPFKSVFSVASIDNTSKLSRYTISVCPIMALKIVSNGHTN